jgi:hypothetical protein
MEKSGWIEERPGAAPGENRSAAALLADEGPRRPGRSSTVDIAYARAATSFMIRAT